MPCKSCTANCETNLTGKYVGLCETCTEVYATRDRADEINRDKQERTYIVAALAVIIPITLTIWCVCDSQQIQVFPRPIALIGIAFGTQAAKAVMFLLYLALFGYCFTRLSKLTKRINLASRAIPY